MQRLSLHVMLTELAILPLVRFVRTLRPQNGACAVYKWKVFNKDLKLIDS